MAPLENGSFQPSVWDEAGRHRVDSLMRALLYITQQVGRPVSEADIRRLTTVPAAGLDEEAFLSAATRLGLEGEAVDLGSRLLDELPVPFALLAAGGPVHVIVSGRANDWTVLDVVEGRVWQATAKQVGMLGARALLLRPRLGERPAEPWYAPLWMRVRPVVGSGPLNSPLTSSRSSSMRTGA